ncbi:hypothetical protein ACOMHN_023615 [Nucella lapillus]
MDINSVCQEVSPEKEESQKRMKESLLQEWRSDGDGSPLLPDPRTYTQVTATTAMVPASTVRDGRGLMRHYDGTTGRHDTGTGLMRHYDWTTGLMRHYDGTTGLMRHYHGTTGRHDTGTGLRDALVNTTVGEKMKEDGKE